MNKKLMTIGLMVFAGSFANASSCNAGATSCDQTSAAVAISTEEALFVAKLSPTYIQAFNLMSIEQRHEALEVARNEALDADAAVNNVLQKHHLAVVDGALKTTTAH